MNDFYGNQENMGYGYDSHNEMPEMENNFSGVAKIKVIGVGGAGNNAVNRLIESGLETAEYIVVNTDNQVLARSKARKRIQIGVQATKGLGAGADPAVGKLAAEENKAELQEALRNTDLLFITAGMGGGTGTGAAPVIAKIAKEMKVLTVAVVTLPFTFEGKKRMDNAITGMEDLKKYVDAIITIPNDKIIQVVPKGTSIQEALKVADEVLRQGIRGISELIVNPSLINLDFADVKTTLKGKGIAHMGIGVAKGEKRIFEAVRSAVGSPLLNTTIEGASSVILNVIGGSDLSLEEVSIAADLVKGVIDYSANVIFGACIDERMSDEVEVVIIATGFANQNGLTGLDGRSVNRGEGQQGGVFNPMSAFTAPTTAPTMATPYFSNPAAPQTPTYNNQQTSPMNGVPVTPQPIAQPTSFEPNDPIVERREAPDRKHRPRFVDFFMRKNSNDDSSEE